MNNRNKNFRLQNHLLVLDVKRKYSLTFDNFSLRSQQLVPNYILYLFKCPDVHLWEILAQFWPNKHFFHRRPFSSWIVNLLTWQNNPEGGYDEKTWEMVYNWLMMTSSAEVWEETRRCLIWFIHLALPLLKPALAKIKYWSMCIEVKLRSWRYLKCLELRTQKREHEGRFVCGIFFVLFTSDER